MTRYTFRELLDDLSKLTEEQLDMDVAVYDGGSDECFGDCGFEINETGEKELDTLQLGHPYISF